MSTRHINPEGLHRSPAFSQAVVVEQPTKTIYIGGQNGVDADGKVVGPTVGEQASHGALCFKSPEAPRVHLRYAIGPRAAGRW
jgi:enamine deaminase RidA (YjgF/YER057c/UK114 family)